MISVFATALLENRSPTIYGDGEQTRDFTYVANVVDGVLRACEAKDASGQVINVATAGRISLNELFRKMREIVGAQVQPTYVEARTGDVRDSQADIGKAQRILGYTPTVSFEEGLRRRSRGIDRRHPPAPPPESVRQVRRMKRVCFIALLLVLSAAPQAASGPEIWFCPGPARSTTRNCSSIRRSGATRARR